MNNLNANDTQTLNNDNLDTVVQQPTTALVPRRSERGEGVISTAIAVLVIAFLGVGMWAGFNQIFDESMDNTKNTINQIGE